MPQKPRPFALAVISALLVTVGCIVAVLAKQAAFPSAPATPFVAAVLLAMEHGVLSRVGKGTLGPRGRVVTALTLAGVSIPVGVATLYALGEPVVSGSHHHCGTAVMTVVMMAPFAVLTVTALSSLMAVVAVRGAPEGLARRVRLLARAAALVTAGLVALSLARAARFPDPDGYVASLPVVARVTAASGEAVGETRDWEGSPWKVYDERIGNVVLRRQCSDTRCEVGLVRPSPPPTDHADAHRDFGLSEEVRAELALRRDAAHDLWVLDAANRIPYRGAARATEDVNVHDLADTLSPPRGWIGAAAAGLALALALLARRRRLAHRRAALQAGREGILEASGLVRFDDGEPPVRVAPGQPLAEGPVVVLPGTLVAGGVYRGDAPQGGARVACGAKDALLARASADLARLDALAFAACALTGAPLVASALAGIVL